MSKNKACCNQVIEEISKGDFSNLKDMVDAIPVDAETKKKLKDCFKAAAILFDVLPSDIKSMVQKVIKDIINKDLDNLVKEGDDLPADINFKKMLKKAVDDGNVKIQQQKSGSGDSKPLSFVVSVLISSVAFAF